MGLRTPDLVLGLMYDVIYVNIIVYYITQENMGESFYDEHHHRMEVDQPCLVSPPWSPAVKAKKI